MSTATQTTTSAAHELPKYQQAAESTHECMLYLMKIGEMAFC